MPLPRFSLRSLLTVAVLLAILGYWRDRPRQTANRFAAMIRAGDYSAAEAMFGERVGLVGKPTIFGDFQVELMGQTPGDWLRGRYPLTVTADLPGGDVYALGVEATATGVNRAAQWNLTSEPFAAP